MNVIMNIIRTIVIAFVGGAIGAGLVIGIILLFHNRYQITAIYCNVQPNTCVYRNVGVDQPQCPEWWDNTGTFDKVNNLKLEPSTCKVTSNGKL